MNQTLTATLTCLAASLSCTHVWAESPPASTVPELRQQLDQFKQREPARYRALAPRVEQLERKQARADLIWYGSLVGGTAVISGAVALAQGKKCADMPEDTAEQMHSKASCEESAANLAGIGLGVGLVTFVAGYVASEFVEPSKKEVRSVAAGQKKRPARRMRLDLGADPSRRSVGASMRFVF